MRLSDLKYETCRNSVQFIFEAHSLRSEVNSSLKIRISIKNVKVSGDRRKLCFYSFNFFIRLLLFWRFLIILAAIFLITDLSSAEEVTCELTFVRGWSLGSLKTCSMQESTVIDAPLVRILSNRDESVKALTFEENKKISFLPLETFKKFPNLNAYAAWGCSIKIVQKEHFQNLINLMLINLAGNQIEIIYSDTFEGLTKLKEFYIRRV